MDKEFIEYPEDSSNNNEDAVYKKTSNNVNHEDAEKKVSEPVLEEKKKGSNIGWILLIFLFILGAGSIGYYYGYVKDAGKKEREKSAQVTESEANFLVEEKTKETAEDSCDEELTSEEKDLSADWKTYTNTKYGFTFKYPKTWKLEDEQADRVVLSSGSDKLNFYFTSAEMSAFDLMQYKKDSEKTVNVACVSAKEVFMSGDPTYEGGVSSKQKVIVTSFEKNSTPHVIMMDYEDQGASISADIKEAYEVILKTIKFE